MLVTMNQITKNAPFGTDDTPNMQMKIIGGRRVHVPVEQKQQNEEHETGYQRQWLAPHPGPHGTPSILTQPDWEAYDSGLQSGFSTSEQHKLARKISSYTSPMGDRSHSFKHGIPTLNTKAVLPPIATQPSGSHTYHHNYTFEHETSNNNATLEDQIGRQMKNFEVQQLKDMYIDLTTFDRRLTGLISESQFSLVALRHDLPLKLSLLKLLFAKFTDARDPTSINYETILQFLSECAAKSKFQQTIPTKQLYVEEDFRSKTSPPVLSPRESVTSLTDNPQQILNMRNQSQLNHIPAQGHTSPLRREEEDKLIGLIMAQLSENIDLEELKVSFQELDRVHSGQLPIHVVKSTCIKCRLPLTDSIVMKMLGRAETNSGMVDWKCFMEPLERVQGLHNGQKNEVNNMDTSPPWVHRSSPRHLTPKSRASLDHSPFLKTGLSDAPVPQNIPWERPPLGKISSDVLVRKSSDINTLPPSRASTISSHDELRVNLPEGWDEREPLERDSLYVSPRQTEPWINKFNKLAHALRTYHPHNAKILPRDEAERVTKNYNLIYGLGFSEKKIENAVHQSLLPRKDDSPGHRISVDALLELLEGKRRFLM